MENNQDLLARILLGLQLNASGSTQAQQFTASLPEGRVPIDYSGFGMGGRVGFKYPTEYGDIGAGVTGSWNKGAVNFAPEMQKYGSPASTSYNKAKINGLDLSLTRPAGDTFSADWSGSGPKDQRFMLRYNTKF
jgi:hypothetical protein